MYARPVIDIDGTPGLVAAVGDIEGGVAYFRIGSVAARISASP